MAILREVIGGRTPAEWTERFATLAGLWAPDSQRVLAAAQTEALPSSGGDESSAGRARACVAPLDGRRVARPLPGVRRAALARAALRAARSVLITRCPA